MRPDTLAQVRRERLELRRHGMVGYVLYHPASVWDGQLYKRRHRADAALERARSDTIVALVHHTGALYRPPASADARPSQLVHAGSLQCIPMARTQRRRLRRASDAQARQVTRHFTGHHNPSYLD